MSKLKLSEAILLGDSLKKRNAYAWLDEDEDGTICGCALGGAVLAIGRGKEYLRGTKGFYSLLLEEWPWIRGYTSAIGGMYARGTIEQVADFVDSIEPAPEPEVEVEPSIKVEEEVTV